MKSSYLLSKADSPSHTRLGKLVNRCYPLELNPIKLPFPFQAAVSTEFFELSKSCKGGIVYNLQDIGYKDNLYTPTIGIVR